MVSGCYMKWILISFLLVGCSSKQIIKQDTEEAFRDINLQFSFDVKE